jgi:predicted transcriptional regulator
MNRGPRLTREEIIASGEAALKIADALTSTSLRILQLVSQQPLNVTAIAKKLQMSEAYMSEQIRTLEEAKLIEVSYERGKRGIRKLCKLAVRRIIIVIKPD